MRRREGRMLQTEDVCRRYGIPRMTLHRWCASEQEVFPKPIKIGRRNYYDETEILRWELRRAGLNPDLPESIKGARVVSDFITEYDDLVKAFVAQRQRLQMTVMEVDARSGMQEGYTTKLENYQRSYGRGVGPESLPLWLGGLRLAIVLVELPRAPRNFRDKTRPGIASVDDVEAA
ncbi:helix-turn-helix domain-containing protein [Agrobacterium tumefaciens]|uniref:helix-turn-helix transcriptional regulator n=1 Tax=Agrobacterium tumefaciens TaxID=358 RepID=UPI00285B4D8E|nr:helix-turn-helix domain-containing protein [Agrobacterium tumefaciens]MDR6589539.1 putative DNA-binding transcriptional regulator AlpA [Agrobacterium tumefaciens]